MSKKSRFVVEHQQLGCVRVRVQGLVRRQAQGVWEPREWFLRPVLLAQKQIKSYLGTASVSTEYNLGIRVAGSVYRRSFHANYSCSSSVW